MFEIETGAGGTCYEHAVEKTSRMAGGRKRARGREKQRQRNKKIGPEGKRHSLQRAPDRVGRKEAWKLAKGREHIAENWDGQGEKAKG